MKSILKQNKEEKKNATKGAKLVPMGILTIICLKNLESNLIHVLCICITDILKMYMWKFNDLKIILIKLQHFKLSQNIDHCTYGMMVKSAYVVKSTPTAFSVSF